MFVIYLDESPEPELGEVQVWKRQARAQAILGGRIYCGTNYHGLYGERSPAFDDPQLVAQFRDES